jgi:hypothetical protein
MIYKKFGGVMKKILFLAVILAFFISGTASAATVTSLYGDIDGYGIGFAVGESFSGFYPVLSKNDAADIGTITDQWLLGDQSWTHTYDISGLSSITSVGLEVVTLGQGWWGTSYLYFDDIYVGALTDGDDSTPGGTLDTNWSRKDVFDLSSFIASIDGVNTITGCCPNNHCM